MLLLRRALLLGCLFAAVESYTSTTTNVKKLDHHDHYDNNAAYERYKGKERSTYGTKNKGEGGWSESTNKAPYGGPDDSHLLSPKRIEFHNVLSTPIIITIRIKAATNWRRSGEELAGLQ